jgi:hypothetical protein
MEAHARRKVFDPGKSIRLPQFHAGQQTDVFIEAPPKAKIIANKSGGDVLKTLAHSSYQ